MPDPILIRTTQAHVSGMALAHDESVITRKQATILIADAFRVSRWWATGEDTPGELARIAADALYGPQGDTHG